MNRFSKEFLLGASTAAHQVEGNNIHSDYWAQEQMRHSDFAEPSLDAVDHYHRYEEDIRLMAKAGLNAYRFSIEWARIEPEEGKFDIGEVEHYRKVIRCCKENGIKPIVTMLHFTSPKWLIDMGGWEAESTITYFVRYCTYIAIQLGSELEYVCTINEANMGLQIAAIGRRYMQQMRKKGTGKQEYRLRQNRGICGEEHGGQRTGGAEHGTFCSKAGCGCKRKKAGIRDGNSSDLCIFQNAGGGSAGHACA